MIYCPETLRVLAQGIYRDRFVTMLATWRTSIHSTYVVTQKESPVIEIGKQWHVNHVVDDYRGATDWYRSVFGANEIFTDEWLDAEKRWASMVAIGDLAVDVMQPTPEGAHLPLGKFLSRFGPHLHAAAYFVDSPPAEVYDALTEVGVRCFGLAGSGRDAMAAQPMSPVFTHPKDTAGQLEFMPFTEVRPGPLGVPGKWDDPRFRPGWTVRDWNHHPAAITGWRIGVVVDDLDRATTIYRTLGARVLSDDDDVAGSLRRRISFGANTIVELIKPTSDDSIAAKDLADNGEIIHSCIFETSAIASAESHLNDCGVVLAERLDGRLIADPKSCHGAVIEFVSAESAR